MKHSISLFLSFLLLTTLLISKEALAEQSHERDKFGFVAVTPDDWSIYREDEGRNGMILDFALPRIWSELEKQDIENAVAVTAIANEAIVSVEKVIQFENRRTESILVSSEETTSTFGKAFIRITNINGIEYKSKVVCHFNGGIGYTISFTATEGTYDKNIGKFEEFLSKLKFKSPAPEASIDDTTEKTESGS